ncbi:tellurite resistance/C4-dicarboxylate transporter family protein [Arthrobacter roseus]
MDAAMRNLPPASFAFVMASAITALGFRIIERDVISLVLFYCSMGGAFLLTVATIWRFVRYRASVISDVKNPTKTFGFFTIVAAANVLGAYLSSTEFTAFAIALFVFAALVWLVLTYLLPALVLFGHGERSVMADVNGSWFLWVVGTQSVATAAAITAPSFHPELLGPAAVGLWGVGIALYLLVATLVTLRMLVNENSPTNLSPTYWIYMGATAISVLAGSRILLLPDDLPIMATTGAFVSGMSYLLWALGLWWIPLLIIFGIWRHGVRRAPLKYETALWSIVFPLGMYSVASMFYGVEKNLAFMIGIGHAGIWVAGIVWLLSTVAMLRTGFSWWTDGGRGNPRQPSATTADA